MNSIPGVLFFVMKHRNDQPELDFFLFLMCLQKNMKLYEFERALTFVFFSSKAARLL